MNGRFGSILMRSVIAAATVATLAGGTGCKKVEGTGRRQLIITSESDENKLGAQAYTEMTAKEKLCTDQEVIDMVQRVGRRLATVAPDRKFQYEFKVLDSKTVNAYCLPGGKVAVYTGILPVCYNEAGLAAVMGHEIAHAIARHGGERMSQQAVVQGLQKGIESALQSQGMAASEANIAASVFGAGAALGVILPYSRDHEREADILGLDYMAKAGYDPREAAEVWKRMAALSGGKGGPGFLSTHPASAERAKNLDEAVPKVMKYYNASPKFGVGQKIPDRYMSPRP